MKIGFDIDGVLANFALGFSNRLIKNYGIKFPLDMNLSNPPKWDWFYPFYSKWEVGATFDEIHKDAFWYGLTPFKENVSTLALVIQDLEYTHDVYFITNRSGRHAKRYTEAWLQRWLPYEDRAIRPTVLITGDKGAAVSALKLDAYIDDYRVNMEDVLKASKHTRVYLLDKNYNQGSLTVCVSVPDVANGNIKEERTAIRIPSLSAFLDAELSRL